MDLQRLIKIEERMYQIAREDLGLDFCDIEFDIVPKEKMFEIMAYHLPGQISNWKFGREFEKTRTIYERVGGGLPYVTVINTNPSRAYLMKDNTFAVQALIIAHVIGHVAFFTMNEIFKKSDRDIVGKLSTANKRFNDYERKYGIDLVEATVDAGHSLMWHSSPLESNETEDEKRERIYKQKMIIAHDRTETEFSDMFNKPDKEVIDRDLFNHQLYMELKNSSPVEPTEDFLRYIIDNSRHLADWQKDILEILRYQGRYYYPQMKTKYMNEGFATWCHETICRMLFKDGTLTSEENAEFAFVNSLVKAKNPFSMNPYLIGSGMMYDIEDRWNKGRFGDEWDECEDNQKKEVWDTGAMQGRAKILQTVRTHTDWMFMENFLTPELVRELKMYVHVKQRDGYRERIVVTDKKSREIRDMVVKSFSHSGIPRIYIVNGSNTLHLDHEHVGIDLEETYAKETVAHFGFLWGGDVILKTKKDKLPVEYIHRSNIVGGTSSSSSS